MRTLIYIMLAGIIIMSACTPKPEAINYGNDGCDYCKMTIVDKRYAAELVTTKGKVYKFDAVECMINYKKENTDTKWILELVSDFNSQQLVDAANSSFLRCAQLSSPMGMYITPFAQEESAVRQQEKCGGELYSWESLCANFDHLPLVNAATSKQ